MASRPFVHLHCHSHYSLLDGASKVPDLVRRSKALGMPALAITDHGNLYGAVEFLREAKAHDFQATLQEHVNHRDTVFYGNPDFYWGYNNPDVVKLVADAEAAATEADQVAKLTEANKLIAEDAASNWLYLYPQIVVSSSTVTGYPVNGLNSQFFAYGIKKAK